MLQMLKITQKENLMAIHYSTLILLNLKLIYAIWLPELDFLPNFDQFHIYKSKRLENILYSSIDNDMSIDFQWQSVAAVGLTLNKISYIIYGGSKQSISSSKTAFSKTFSAIVICKLVFRTENTDLDDVKCSKVITNDTNFYLGITIAAVTISNNEAAITYCDPLWHVANSSEPKPNGKCYLNFIKNGQFLKNTSIEFCGFSSTSCLAGFSVDLACTNNRLSELQMVVGFPFLTPYGRVKIIDDPFNFRRIIDPRNGIGKYFNFGYAVSMRTTSTAYASSPLSDHFGPNVTDIRNDLVLMMPDNSIFGSFGLSLKTLLIGGGHSHAVVIGAPFYPMKSMSNVGKVYVYCVSNNDSRHWLSAQLNGEYSDEFFGYVLSNIGDIDGDGNEDLAVSSPFLRNDDGRGFVSLYSVTSSCQINQKPLQVLRGTHYSKQGIFGMSVAGGADIDFNNWPDIVVLNSRTNSIDIFASRKKLKADCKFSFDKTFENNLLTINEIIEVKTYISLIDVLNSRPTKLAFLNYYNLVSQVDPNQNSHQHRLTLHDSPITYSLSQTLVTATFVLRSLLDIKDMNMSIPIVIAFRFLENCSSKDCDNIKFPLIDWENCKSQFPARKFVCSDLPNCNADLSIKLVDPDGSEVIFGFDKMFSRVLTLKISNAGPTPGKDINVRLSVFQNLRVHRIKAVSRVSLTYETNQNQTEAICRFEQEEIEIKSDPILVNIELYFVNFNNINEMNYRNNFILAEVFSDVRDPNITNNQARIDYIFTYAPNIQISGAPLKETVRDPRNGSQPIRYGNRLSTDAIGPMLTHQYWIENSGNGSVTNMTVKVTIPVETEDGYPILYLFERIRGFNGSQSFWMSISPQIHVGDIRYPCQVLGRHINPLNIISYETHQSHMSNIDIRQISDWTHKLIRRSADDLIDYVGTSSNVQSTQGKLYRIPVEIVQCDRQSVNLKSPVCAEIHCNVPLLPPHKRARLQINAWLWAYTLFTKQIADIMVYTTLQVDFTEIPDGVLLKWNRTQPYSQAQHFIFPNFKSRIRHFKPVWPIVLGIVVGILILSIIIVAMYKCGFFQRNKAKENLKPKKPKRTPYNPVILHPTELQTSSSGETERRMTSHSTLIA